jgi:ABC-type nitrate/sulfonate/bicarbonate transport system permease component
MRHRLATVLPPLGLLIALIGAWELYVDLGGVDPVLLPAPHSVASTAWKEAGLLWHNTLVTLKEVSLGLALAVATGFALAVAIHLWRPVRRSVYPLAVGSQALPFAVLAPVLAFWLGFGIVPKLVVIGLICFFPVTVTTVDGLSAVDPDQIKLLHTLDASRWQAFRFGELPAALPAALSGARIALVVAWIAAFIAETTSPTVGPYAGLGRQITTDIGASVNSAGAAAGTAVLFVCSIVCFYLLSLAERRVAGWAQPQQGENR